AHRAGPDGARRLDVRHVHDAERARAHDARDPRDDRDRYRGDDVRDLVLAGPERSHDRDRDDDEREAEKDVHEPLDDLIDLPAEIRADHPEDKSERATDERRAEPDEQRGSRTVDDPREDVPPERVSPEQVLQRRALQEVAETDLDRVVWRDPIGERRGEEHHDDQHGSRGAERPPPDELPPETDKAPPPGRLEVTP